MINLLLHYQRKMSPVNAWPWRGLQACRGSRGRKGG
jgi:hypothetical protein